MHRFFISVVVMLCMGFAKAGTWTMLPLIPSGIDGSNVLGLRADGKRGQIYDLDTGSIIVPFHLGKDVPFFTTGIGGNNIVGVVSNYTTNGFLWQDISNGGPCIDLQNPFSHAYTNPIDLSVQHDLTYPYDIDSSNIVGYYQDNNYKYRGFLYTGSVWMTLDYSGAKATYAYSISGSNIVGQYYVSGDYHGFLYNTTTKIWSTIPILASAIDGSNIVGGNMLYNLTTGKLTTLDVPGSITSISGNNLVGTYMDSSGINHGFIYTIPDL